MKNNYSKLVTAFFLTLLSLFIFSEDLSAKAASPAADCGCTITLTANTGGGIYYDGKNVKPGSKVCIAAGNYTLLGLFNFVGTAAAPITFINCGGQVVVSGPNYGFSIFNSSYFVFTGTGTAGIPYGFKTTGGAGRTLTGLGLSSATNFTIDHIEIHKAGVGVICKKNPTCDPATWEQNFTMRNLVFHDLYLHDIGTEAFYIGHTSSVVKVTCNGSVIDARPPKVRGVKIYNCKVDGCGWDGIQLASAPEAAEIYNNTVTNFGTQNHSSQQAGIILGGMSTGKVYNNHVSNGTGNGIQIFGAGLLEVFNNVVANVGVYGGVSNPTDGIFIDDRPVAGYPALHVAVNNNTIVSPKRAGIRMENTNQTITMSEFHNNLVVASGEANPAFTTVVVRGYAPNHSTNNVYVPTVSAAKFVSTTNYHLTGTSPALDKGMSVAAYGILTDKDGLSRSVGASPDAGAYEYAGAAAPPAGTDPSLKAIPGKIEAESFNAMAGVQSVATSDAGGGSCVGYIAKGDWFEYNTSVAAAGNYTATFRISSLNSNSQLAVTKSDGTVLALINVPKTGGNQTWSTVSATINLPAGLQTLRIVSNTNGANGSSSWNINWVNFAAAGTGVNNAVQAGSITAEDASTASGAATIEKGMKASFGIFPNPVTTTLNLQVNNGHTGPMKVQLVDILGKVRKEMNLNKNQQLTQLNVPTNTLPSGVYFIQVQVGAWKDSRKFVKL